MLHFFRTKRRLNLPKPFMAFRRVSASARSSNPGKSVTVPLRTWHRNIFIINGVTKTTNSINFLCLMFRLCINLVRCTASLEAGNTPWQWGSAVHRFRARLSWPPALLEVGRLVSRLQALPQGSSPTSAPPYRLLSHSVSHHFDLHARFSLY